MKQIAAAIIKEENKILICQRKAGGPCSLLWEFPGGKREKGETFSQCVIRECQEELGIEITQPLYFDTIFHTYDGEVFCLLFFHCKIKKGVPKMFVHQELRWAAAEELSSFAFCPADQPILEKLKKNESL